MTSNADRLTDHSIHSAFDVDQMTKERLGDILFYFEANIEEVYDIWGRFKDALDPFSNESEAKNFISTRGYSYLKERVDAIREHLEAAFCDAHNLLTDWDEGRFGDEDIKSILWAMGLIRKFQQDGERRLEELRKKRIAEYGYDNLDSPEDEWELEYVEDEKGN